MKPYIAQKLEYTDDGRLLDEKGFAVMMDWEEDIMKASAKAITKSGGHVLNIGFGMGIIDTEIQRHNPKSHTIIECHPDVQKKMIEEGWLKKENVKVIFAKWQDVIEHLPRYDGIYIDTWDEELDEFHMYVHNLLTEKGIYSWFNNPRDNNKKILDKDKEILYPRFNVEFEEHEIKFIPEPDFQTNSQQYYWHPTWKKYYLPKATLKKD